jgi:hypothetical protein
MRTRRLVVRLPVARVRLEECSRASHTLFVIGVAGESGTRLIVLTALAKPA